MIIVNPTEKCKYQAYKPKVIHNATKDEKCTTDEFETKLRKEIEKMAEIKVLGANVERANPKAIENLIKIGILYVGEDNQLHVIDLKENALTPPTKAE